MSTNLIKLLVNIEESGVKSNYTLRPSRSEKRFYSSRDLPTVSQQSLIHSKEKQARRALRSKITKILQTLPHHCEKEEQKVFSIKWAKQKKRYYEVNKQRLILGKDPLNKLNLSSDSEKCEKGCFSAREVLLKNLKADELALLSEDPLYFIPDKTLFKSNVENDWDQLIRNDPKDPENQQKKKKKEAQIDFLKGPEENFIKTRSLKNKKKPIFKIRVASPIYSKTPNIGKPLARPFPFCKNSEKIEVKSVRAVKSFQNLEKAIQKKSDFKVLAKPINEANPMEPFEQFLKVTNQYEQRLRYSLKKSAADQKLVGVKKLLKKWESKKRTSL